MAKTIIQTIGPLYGEVVNGTVFGRPNGSVYVPPSNKMTATVEDSYKFIRSNAGVTSYLMCDSAGQAYTTVPAFLFVVAETQDLANYIEVQVATDSEFTDIIGSRAISAGVYNTRFSQIANGTTALEAGTTYYIRAVLKSAGGEPVAYSESIEVKGVVLS